MTLTKYQKKILKSTAKNSENYIPKMEYNTDGKAPFYLILLERSRREERVKELLDKY